MSKRVLHQARGVLGAASRPAWADRPWALPLGVFGVAFCTRLLLLEPHLTCYPFQKYPLLAAHLLGEGAHEPFNAAPLYIYFWVVMHRLFDFNDYWPRLVQLFGGSVGCALTAVAARQVFGPVAGLLAGLAAAFYAPLIAHDGIYLSEWLVVLLNAGALAALLHARSDGRARWWMASGLLLGLSAITRPNILLWTPFAAAWAVWGGLPGAAAGADRGHTPAAFWRTGAVAVLCVCLGVGIPLGLIVFRNYRVSGDPVLVMSDGGIVFYIANNRLDQGPSYIWPRSEPLFELGELDPTHRIARETASRIVGRELTHSQSSRFWLERGLEFVRAEPGRWLWLCWRKLVYFWRDYEVPDTMAQHAVLRSLRGLPLLTFGMVAPLATLGMALGLRRWREQMLLFGLVIVYALTAIAFGVESRYRLPAMPALFPFAAGATLWLWEAARQRRWRALAPAVALTAATAWSANLRDFQIWKMDTRMQVVLELQDPAAELIRAGRYAEAIPKLERIVAEKPVFEAVADAHTLLARAYASMGNRERAAEHLRLAVGPLCWERAPWHEERSRETLAAEARANPWDVFSRQALGYLAWKSGDYAAAARWFREVTELSTAHVN
ncbi:MAG: glycosyltransferase family 39 protein, partial [Armatimonadota bacterium]|nr:glycosyltransferase family 39 protein [Armatimonadota bacterium]